MKKVIPETRSPLEAECFKRFVNLQLGFCIGSEVKSYHAVALEARMRVIATKTQQLNVFYATAIN